MAASSTKSSPPLELAELILQVQDLQKRVRNLEVRLGTSVTAAPSVDVPVQLPSILSLPPNTVTTVGRMLLAIAGAYVLRTLTDWHILPPAAGVGIHALLVLWSGGAGIASSGIPTDTLGTVVLMSFALGLAWAGARWRKTELVWVLYGLMVLGAYKLATRDFVDEHNSAMVISLLCYGGALVILPRLLRARRINPEP